MASDSSSGFRQGISHFFTATKQYNPEGGRKNKRTIWTWISSKRKRGSFVWRFCAAFRASWACIFRESSTKTTRNANSSLTVFPHSLLQLTVLPLDCYLTLTGLFCSPLSTTLSLSVPLSTDLSLLSHLPLLVHFRSRGRLRAQALCLGFAPK